MKMMVYHRKRICFHQLLLQQEGGEKSPNLSLCTRPFQSTKQLWARAPLSINQATLSARPFQSTRQLWARTPLAVSETKILSSPYFNWKFPPHTTWPGTSFFYLPQQLIQPSCLTPRPKEPTQHTPFLPFWAWYPLMRPRGLHMAIRLYHRRSDWSQDRNGRYFSSWNNLTVKKSASKSSAVSAQEVGILYWPACWVAYKRKPGRAQSSVCSQWSTPPHPSWTQPELHHLDTVCWISKFPIVNSATFLERALINRGALTSINQANLSAPLSSERAPFKWAHPFPSIRQLECALLKRVRPSPFYQTVSQELRMNGVMAKARTSLQKLNEDSHTSVAPVSCLSSLRLRCWRGCVVVDRSSYVQVRGPHLLLRQHVLGALPFSRRKKLNAGTHTSVALVSCMSSSRLRHWRGCVFITSPGRPPLSFSTTSPRRTPPSQRKNIQFLPFPFLSLLYFINHILEYACVIFSIVESFAHKALVAFNYRLRFNCSII